jgi:hypothetical protein
VACIKVVTLLDYLSLAAWKFIVVDRAKLPCIEVNVLSRRIIIRLRGDVKRFMQKARRVLVKDCAASVRRCDLDRACMVSAFSNAHLLAS